MGGRIALLVVLGALLSAQAGFADPVPNWSLDGVDYAQCESQDRYGHCQTWDTYLQKAPDREDAIRIATLYGNLITQLQDRLLQVLRAADPDSADEYANIKEDMGITIDVLSKSSFSFQPCLSWNSDGSCAKWYSSDQEFLQAGSLTATVRSMTRAINDLIDRTSDAEAGLKISSEQGSPWELPASLSDHELSYVGTMCCRAWNSDGRCQVSLRYQQPLDKYDSVVQVFHGFDDTLNRLDALVDSLASRQDGP